MSHTTVQAVPTTEASLLALVVQVLSQLEAHQRALVDHERVVAEQHAALVEQQRLIAEQQAALVEQQRIIANAAIRAEIRACNGTSGLWRPLPLTSGAPFPADRIKFPSSAWILREMKGEAVLALGEVYDIIAPDETFVRKILEVFIAGVSC
ncbi:hypothetical protein OBBRIDRAFT_348243 [Obba rivulosa]|uniref:Uncharacterized protein n=1 Tax=Obba rivulosa TaxID=1052685 RepID=A0A8E2AIV4_9APHY|nr:hypothetical protein OBBRIDRAFT_348243 [Obba rivulosa]